MTGKKLITVQAKLFAWLILFFSFSFYPLAGQKYFFDNYGIRQGLSEQKVYKLFQDSKDYIWLGTANGVSRFDGKTFRNFTSRRDFLAPGGVNAIIEDSLKYLWFGHNDGGISRYNGQYFEQCAFDSLILTGNITSIIQTGNKMWFTSETDGVILVDYPVKDIRHMRGKQFRGKERLSDQVFGSYLTKDGSLICVADIGLRKYNSVEKKFENYRMPHMTTYFSTSCLLEDIKGNMWFGTYNGGIYKYNMADSKMEIFDLPKMGVSSNWIYCLTEDSHGRIWAGTFGGGIAVIDGDEFRKFDASNGLDAAKIYDIIEDVEGNILIADQDNGLTIFKGDAFVTLNEKEILADPNVNAIYQDEKNAMWFATNSGISRYFPDTDNKTIFYNKIDNQGFTGARFFKRDQDGNLWMGANTGGVILYDMKRSRFEPQPDINGKAFWRETKVTALEIDKKNNLWIGTLAGLAFGKINGQNFGRTETMDSVTFSQITALYCDPSGNMWIGTNRNGQKPCLFLFDSGKEDFRQENFRQIGDFAGIEPKTMVMDVNGVLWVGTSQGLLAYKNDSIISTLTQDDGLLSDNINLLVTDNDGNIFIGTNLGLNRYDPATGRIFSYTKKNGFTGIETKQNAVFKSPSGDIWFGTANGAIRLSPQKIHDLELEPLTHILSMQVNNQAREMIPGFRLRYNEAKYIVFNYNSICLTNPDIVKYKVQLEGASDSYTLTDQTSVSYPPLRPGKYTFNVIACNSQGIWNSKPVSFHFIIRPPFYSTWWFILSVSVVLIIAVIIYIKLREQNLRKEKIILEEKVEERTAEVVQKSKEIEEKNRDIMASIRYAERIQRAMLPRENTFQETFVLFMPKDVVSGDFYWMYDNGDVQFIAVVDCTGHGVPGAFMSIIGHNALNKIVREYGLIRPSAIMDQLNIEVMKALLQRHEKAITDGMDIALIAFNKKEFTLEFAGAYNPLYVVRKGEVSVYKGDRFPVGMTTKDEKKSFANQTIEIQPGDMLYMCSDGYADQFGSPEVKKYKSANVKKLLAGICDLPICLQKDMLEKEILDWKGELEQVDDILFIGTKIPGN